MNFLKTGGAGRNDFVSALFLDPAIIEINPLTVITSSKREELVVNTNDVVVSPGPGRSIQSLSLEKMNPKIRENTTLQSCFFQECFLRLQGITEIHNVPEKSAYGLET